MAAKKNPPTSKKMLAAEQAEKTPSTHPVLILVAGFVSAFMLLFCCVCGGAAWWFRPEIHDDPNRAAEVVAEIVDITIPETYQPQGTIEWNVAYAMSIRGAYYERFAGDGLLTIVEVNSRLRSEEDVRRHIRETLIRKGGGGTPLIIDDSETKKVEVEIRGGFVPFTFEIGRNPTLSENFHIVEGVFEGKSGDVLLAMRVNEDDWEEQSIIDMLNSIGDTASAESPSPETIDDQAAPEGAESLPASENDA